MTSSLPHEQEHLDDVGVARSIAASTARALLGAREGFADGAGALEAMGDRMAQEHIAERLVRARPVDAILSEEAKDSAARLTAPNGSRNRIHTPVLLDTIARHGLDACMGGGRCDEEKARAKERAFSFRDEVGEWDPKDQRPELWNLYNGRVRPGENIRVFPLSNWTELDIWQYIGEYGAGLPSMYFAHERDVFERNGMLFAANKFRRPNEGELVETRKVRYRTVGDATLTAAVASDADTVERIINEVAATRITERGATRGDVKVSEAAMDDRKKQGYF